MAKAWGGWSSQAQSSGTCLPAKEPASLTLSPASSVLCAAPVPATGAGGAAALLIPRLLCRSRQWGAPAGRSPSRARTAWALVSRSPHRQGRKVANPPVSPHLAFSRPSLLPSYLPEARVQRGTRGLTLILNACC